MGKEKSPITEKEFEKYKVKGFAMANKELKAFGKKLADYCWNLDKFAVIQNWGGEKEALIAFGVPPEKRRVKRAKNYFTIYKVLDSSDKKLKCEVCFPIDSFRDDLLREHDTDRMLYISSIDQCEGMFEPCDYDYVIKLIHASLACRVKD